jgi:F-type H+-transporting ATPase subunit delta
VASDTTGVSGLAARYAAALFDLADERRMLDEIASDLRQLRGMLQGSGDFLRLIRSPVLSRDQQAKAVGVLAERAGLSPLVRDFLRSSHATAGCSPFRRSSRPFLRSSRRGAVKSTHR